MVFSYNQNKKRKDEESLLRLLYYLKLYSGVSVESELLDSKNKTDERADSRESKHAVYVILEKEYAGNCKSKCGCGNG